MKSIIKAKILSCLILFFLLACNSKVEQTSKSITKTRINSNTTKKESVILAAKKEKDILDSSFIGKNSTEFEKYNLHGCFWSLLNGKSKEDKFCIALYSKIIEDCRYGKGKIVFGKYSGVSGENVYEIIDELNVISQDPKRVYYHVPLTLENNEENIYLAEFEDNRDEVITKIFRLWKIDIEKEKFIEIKKPKKLTFLNPDYIDE